MLEFPPIGMGPEVWGPIFWGTMHIVSLGYPETPSKEEQAAAANFYNSLAVVIPCPICRAHYSHFLSEMPVERVTGSRKELVFWLFTLHNKVNVQLGKREYAWEEFIENIRALRDKGATKLVQGSSTYEGIGYLLAGVLLGGAGFYAYNQYLKPK